MTTSRTAPMYVNPAIRFRDPFGSSSSSSKDSAPPTSLESYDRLRASRSSQPPRPDFNRELTPPPEMTSSQPGAPKPSYYTKEYGRHFDGHVPAQQVNRAHVTSYGPQEVSNTSYGRNGRVSPIRQAPFGATDAAQQRQPSQHNDIAANFQIPRSVNDSGGSLSELAAQITCLFWFESSEVLQQVEDSILPVQPTRPLSQDAKPTTGFRKWVTTILSTTMVAQNVVLLALLFIYRLKKLNPAVRGKPGSEYRLLTVALMLGNKFLDDNTYTNKTWAEVSGINVAEVHIMEVEFLSNMKYCLFTSEQDWARWQSLLGKFAQFFDRASRPPPPAPLLPPASSLHLPMALPSPPASTQASPPYSMEMAQNAAVYSSAGHLGPTPAPSPLGKPDFQYNQQGSRKRSFVDELATEPPPKRIASGYQSYTSPNRYSTMPAQQAQVQPVPRLTLPSLSIPPSSASVNAYSQLPSQAQQLAPLSVPQRAMGMVFPNASGVQGPTQQVTAPAVSTHAAMQPHSQQASRNSSPYGGSAAASPSSALPSSATALHPPAQISPTYFLQQRNSPYRPVHNVSTLLYPPPHAATQTRSQNIELNQMQYQPLGKPTQHTGRLPYLGQNLWLDGNHPQEMTPVHQWPNFPQQQPMVPQQ